MKKTLKELRMKCGFTQKEIASFLSMPYRTYQNYEEGITSIPDWIYLLIKFKLDSHELYSPTKGIYKIKQIKFLVRDTFKKYKIKRAYLYGDYISKEVNESSPIQILIKSSLDDFGSGLVKEELEKIFSKSVQVLDIKDFDTKSEFTQYILKKGILIYRSY